jgi:hypothetical protein
MLYAVIARSDSDEAIQLFVFAALKLDCFACARNDELKGLAV